MVLQPEKLDEKDKQRLLEQLAQASMAFISDLVYGERGLATCRSPLLFRARESAGEFPRLTTHSNRPRPLSPRIESEIAGSRRHYRAAPPTPLVIAWAYLRTRLVPAI